MSDIIWFTKSFDQLSANELYDILQMRQQVFVVEQTCPFPDLDGIDKLSFHLAGCKGTQVVAYSRIVPPGVLYEEPSVGRVATHLQLRGCGVGHEVFKRALKECEKMFGKRSIKIMAQSYLKFFYESYGFIVHGDAFLEDDILHYFMIRP